MFNRWLNLSLPQGQSAFLWGARNTGKSTFLLHHYPEAVYYDLLQTDELARLMAHPNLLREELSHMCDSRLRYPIIIDEVQKVPKLLDEVHWLIEHKQISFILCGSSARKLRRGGANLLGGRAWPFTFYPLVYKEIPNFNLLRALNQGLLPSHYLTEYPQRMLRAYVSYYLTEEIRAEGLVRNLPGFAKFLEVVGLSHGDMVNYSNIARDCGVDAKTVKEYYQILVDTLVGYFILPFYKKVKRELVRSTPKFYLFDVGVANYMARQAVMSLKGRASGRAFEHFILMELVAFLGMHELEVRIQYWRSKAGLEVDFVLGDAEIAIEVKVSDHPVLADFKGLKVFCEEYQPKHAIVVCQVPRKRILQHMGCVIEVLPWREFLDTLWDRGYL